MLHTGLPFFLSVCADRSLSAQIYGHKQLSMKEIPPFGGVLRLGQNVSKLIRAGNPSQGQFGQPLLGSQGLSECSKIHS